MPPNSGAKVVIYNRIINLRDAFDITFCAPVITPDDSESMRLLQSFCTCLGVDCSAQNQHRENRIINWLREPCVADFKSIFHAFYHHPDLVALVQSGQFDLIEFHHAHWFHPLITQSPAKLVLCNHNNEIRYYFGLTKSHFRNGRWLKGIGRVLDLFQVSRQVRKAIRNSNLIVCVSPLECQDINHHYPKQKAIVNYAGVDLGFYNSTIFEPILCQGSPVLIYIGALFVEHIGDAAVEFATQVFPHIRSQHPDARFLIVGDYRERSDIPELTRNSPGVLVTGLVSDVRPYLDSSDIVVVPLRYGAGVRFKIMEALAMSKPVVSTAKGCEGLGLESGTHIEVVEDLHAMTQSILDLWQDKDHLKQLAAHGREYAEEYFCTRRNHDQLLSVFQSLIN
ncbi:MAG: glycosyltransferase involved in cell wall biosynthesis [Parasphingorhabdus sp.]|jgi:glycosyltransferase involved in cell wall biosynthesis